MIPSPVPTSSATSSATNAPLPVYSPVHPLVASCSSDAEASRSQAVEHENALLAAAIELQSQLDRSDRLEDAAYSLVYAMADILQAGGVVVCWRDSQAAMVRVLAKTAETLDATGIAAAEEQMLLARTVALPLGETEGATQRGGTMAISQWLRALGSRSYVGCCLRDAQQRVCGCLLVLDPQTPQAFEFLDAISAPLSSKLGSIQRNQSRALPALLAALRAASPSKSRTLMIALLAIVLVMFAPATYTIDTKIELQPVQRRFVAAAFDGPLERCHVRPGDVVQAGDLLAEIDPREIQYELAGIESELEQAMQTRKAYVAQQDFAATRLAELELDRLRVKRELLQHRREHLEIRSPIDGIVVSGDWRSREGIPLTRGETLFEIAPLSQMVVELWVPEADIAHVRRGMTVRFFTLASPDQPLVGTIARVHPKSELQDQDNVFLAEVPIRNEAGWLQPGMRGRATIYGDTHCIGWNLLHRPWFALRNWIGV